MPQTQQALVLNEQFGQFTLKTVPVEKPGPGEILVKIKSVALNPVDWKVPKYGVLVEEYPAILGHDISGDVEDVGEGVADFKKGDKVFSQIELKRMTGGFQQYVLCLASTTSKIPPNISYDEAATIPVGLSTAYSGLYSSFPNGLGLEPPISEASKGKYSGTPIFILGGSGSVGQYVLQLAKLSGFFPIITSASMKNSHALKELGATHVLDRNLSTEALKTEIARITSKPLELVYDAVSVGTQQIAIDLVASGGQVLVIMNPTVTPTEGKKLAKATGKLRLDYNIELLETLYHDEIYGLLEKGLIIPNRYEVLPKGLAGILDGLARMEADQVSRLKLVAHPQEE